ncbi:MAG: ATP-binding cassette domain-containing protein, partial [Anaerolineales bacterium]
MLEVKNLTKVYDGEVQALKNVSFTVEQGEFLAVIGLSGSGKSTLLRCINRLIEPTEGQIIWKGQDVTAASQDELRRIRRKIGMVFQHFNLVSRSKVITNVLAGRLGYVNPMLSALNQFPKSDMEMAFAQLDRVGIKNQAYKRADELSGGQQQR